MTLFSRILCTLLVLLASCLITTRAAHASHVGYDWGLYLASDDWNYKLTFSGGVLPRFQYRKQNDALWQPTLVTFMESAYIVVKFDSAKGFKSEFTFGHGTGAPEYATVNIGNAWVQYWVNKYLEIRMGTLSLPLSFGVDGGWMLLNDPPITFTQWDGINNYVPYQIVTPLRSSFGSPWALGLRLTGKVWKMLYQFAVINGNESNFIDNPNKRMNFGGRVRFDILGDTDMEKETDYSYSETPQLSVNLGSIYEGKRTDPYTGADVRYWWTSTLGVGLRWKGFALTSEGYYRRTRFNTLGTATWARYKLTDIGYYVGLGYYIIPKKLELAALGAQIIRQGPDNDSHQLGGSVNWYIHGYNLKIQTSYNWKEDFDDVAGTENNHIHTVDICLQARF